MMVQFGIGIVSQRFGPKLMLRLERWLDHEDTELISGRLGGSIWRLVLERDFFSWTSSLLILCSLDPLRWEVLQCLILFFFFWPGYSFSTQVHSDMTNENMEGPNSLKLWTKIRPSLPNLFESDISVSTTESWLLHTVWTDLCTYEKTRSQML